MMDKNDEKKERIMAIAMSEALKVSIPLTLLVGAGTVAAAYRYKNFNKNTSISIKLALPVMTALGSFSATFEITMSDAKLYPEKYGLIAKPTGEVQIMKDRYQMPIHHKVMNHIYDHPFQMVSGLGLPLAAYILYQQMQLTHLTLSQKIMHTRVFAQGSVLAILFATMGFREYMDRHGRFEEPN